MEYIIIRKMRDHDGIWKWFTFYPEHKNGKPSNIFRLRKKAEYQRLHWVKNWGFTPDSVKVVPYTGKQSEHYIYLDRWS